MRVVHQRSVANCDALEEQCDLVAAERWGYS